MALTLKQLKFVDAYLGKANGNATEAARIAGYAVPRQQGHENLTKPDISAEIARRYAERCPSPDEVLARLGDHARGSLEPFVSQSGDRVCVDITTEAAASKLHLVKKLKTKERSGGRGDDRWTETETEIELHDPQAALVHLGRHYKLFTDKTEQAVTIEGVIGYEIVAPDGTGPSAEDERQQAQV